MEAPLCLTIAVLSVIVMPVLVTTQQSRHLFVLEPRSNSLTSRLTSE